MTNFQPFLYPRPRCKGITVTLKHSEKKLWTSVQYITVFSFLLSLSRCVSESLPGDRRGAGDPQEQHHHPGVAPPGERERRGDMLGVLLLEAGLRSCVEPRRAVCSPQMHAVQRLPHHLPAPAWPGVPRPPSDALKGIESSWNNI